MTDYHDKPYHARGDLVGDPNKPQEGLHKTSFAFVSDILIVHSIYLLHSIYYTVYGHI